MRVVIVGAGAVGFQLAKQLISEKKDVVLIEKSPDVAAHVSNVLDCMVITGEGNRREILHRAGTASADYFVAVTDSDEVNMIACGIVSAEFSVRAKIARVRNFDYQSGALAEKRFLGIDFVVNPEIEAAQAIMRAVESGATSDVMAFEQSRVQIRNVVADHDGPLVGHTLQELSNILPGTFLIAVVIRNNDYLIPRGDTRIVEGDILYVVANDTDFEAIFATLGKARRKLNRVIVVGGGSIGQQIVRGMIKDTPPARSLFQRVARRLIGYEGRQIKIVERNYERCKELIEMFPNALVINADISDDGVFEEQHFANADLVIAATDNQELNIVTALYAKSQGIKRSVVLVSRASYASIAAQLGIDVPVSQKNAVVMTILRVIRSGTVRSVHSINDGRIEAIELTVQRDGQAVGRAIRDLPLPKDALIVAIERNGDSIVPGGSNVIRGNDHLVVIAKKEHGERVQEIFSR